MLGIRGYGIYCRFYGRKAPTIRERDIWDKNPLFGLCFLHKNGITHADLQPGNLLFAVSEINSLSEVELQQDQSCQDQDTTPELLKRRDGKEDQWAPRHLFLGQSLYKYIRFGPEMVVKISDFGAGKHCWLLITPEANFVQHFGLKTLQSRPSPLWPSGLQN